MAQADQQKLAMPPAGLRLPTAADVARAAQLRRSIRTSLFPRDVAQRAAADVTAATAAVVLELPPSAEVGRWMAALVARDGPDQVARALLGALNNDDLTRMMQVLCDSKWGLEPRNEHGVSQIYGLRVCHVLKSSPCL